MELKDLPEDGIVDFYATWCAPCRMMEPILDKMIEEGITVTKVNVEENEELAEYFGITGVPTYVSIQEGKEKQRLVGAVPEAHLRSII